VYHTHGSNFLWLGRKITIGLAAYWVKWIIQLQAQALRMGDDEQPTCISLAYGTYYFLSTGIEKLT